MSNPVAGARSVIIEALTDDGTVSFSADVPSTISPNDVRAFVARMMCSLLGQGGIVHLEGDTVVVIPSGRIKSLRAVVPEVSLFVPGDAGKIIQFRG